MEGGRERGEGGREATNLDESWEGGLRWLAHEEEPQVLVLNEGRLPGLRLPPVTTRSHSRPMKRYKNQTQDPRKKRIFTTKVFMIQTRIG